MPQSRDDIPQDTIQAQGSSQPDAARTVSPEKQPEQEKSGSKRTRGLWAFDALLYPLLTNVAVFLISVYATYKTNFGKDGGWFKKRGDWMKSYMNQKFNWSPKTTEMASMVGFSFLDGSIMAPAIKLFEDKRGQISRWLDRQMGTEPKDDTVYKQEPKQSWLSVLGGRIATFAAVFPTAVALDKIKPSGKPDGANMNDILFRNPAKWMVNKIPSLQKRFPNIKMEGLAATVAFELFYTTLCTAGLYFWSRSIARRFGKKGKSETPETTVPLMTASQNDTNDSRQLAPELEQIKSWVNKTALKTQPVKTENYVTSVDASRINGAGQTVSA